VGAFGFRRLLSLNALISSAFIAACALFQPGVPLAVIFVVLVIGGFFRSLEFTCINAIGYADVEPRRMSRATTLASVAQQVSISTGVALGAFIVEFTLRAHGRSEIAAADFAPAFAIVGLLSSFSVISFLRLPVDAGALLAGRSVASRQPPQEPDRPDQR
jgi:MFS family permease